MEYHVNNENKLRVGDILKDDKNKYVVRDVSFGNTHSQYASHVKAECMSGPHEGRSMWIDHHLATKYKTTTTGES